MIKKIILTGFGTVGREFCRLIIQAKTSLEKKYKLQFQVVGIVGRHGLLYDERGLDLEKLLSYGRGSEALGTYARQHHLQLYEDNLVDGTVNADILVEATPTNITDGEPGLGYILAAINKGMDIVCISKGALVTNFHKIRQAAEEKQVQLKYSGATAAALPTIDIGEYSLIGSEIEQIEGILNGTTNYILTEMHETGSSFEEALRKAQEKGIAETDPSLDIEGIDAACKMVLIANSLLGTSFRVEDVKRTGITQITKEEISAAKQQGKYIKLIAKATKKDGQIHIQVAPEMIGPDHPFYGVQGTTKGILFRTDYLGTICVTGGASNPVATAAAALKDCLNLYR